MNTRSRVVRLLVRCCDRVTLKKELAGLLMAAPARDAVVSRDADVLKEAVRLVEGRD